MICLSFNSFRLSHTVLTQHRTALPAYLPSARRRSHRSFPYIPVRLSLLHVLRHHIEIDPLSVSSCHHALGTENIPIVISALKLLQDIRDLRPSYKYGSSHVPARKHFIRVMMSCMIMMIVTAAAVVVMMMLVIVVVMVLMVVMVLVIMIVVVVVLMLMIVLMVMTAALAVFVMFTAPGTDHLRQKFLFSDFPDSIVSRIFLPGSCAIGVVINGALSFSSRRIAMPSSISPVLPCRYGLR